MSNISHENPTFRVDSNSIGWITFNDPQSKHNVLSERVMRDLAGALNQAHIAESEKLIQALIIMSRKPGSFIAGADLGEIAKLEDPSKAEQQIRLGQAIVGQLAELAIPTIAAVNGTCLGGGTEIALACQYRILSDSKTTNVGLPEVTLGILPALGGTTRLPRLIGLRASLELLLTGRSINAQKAQRIGFAQKVFPEALFDQMVRDFAIDASDTLPRASRRKKTFFRRILDDTKIGRKTTLRMARKKVTAHGQFPAPLRILDILDEHLDGKTSDSLTAEAHFWAELVTSAESKNLLHVFHTRQAARKSNGIDGDNIHPATIEALGVLGAGIMGAGISQLAAYKGVRVYMHDIHHSAITSGLYRAKGLFDEATRRKKLTKRRARQAMELITGGLKYYGLSSAHLIVEAVAEKMDVKTAVLRHLEEVTNNDCIIATNTSSLSIDTLSEDLNRPDFFCGIHFFNPVHRMPLVEIVRGSNSSTETIATAYSFALQLGKVPIVVNDGPGFLVNRVLGPYLNEAGFLLEDGASIRDIDTAAKRFGMPTGPLRFLDEVGFDIFADAGTVMHKAFGERFDPASIFLELYETDRLGKKNGEGFYQYMDGEAREPDESIYSELHAQVPSKTRKFSDDTILNRLLLQMINEAAFALEDGIVQSADQVDLALIMGAGFPPFRGGLLRFADTVHPRGVLYRIQKLEEVYGARFTPAPLLIELAEQDRTFYETFGI